MPSEKYVTKSFVAYKILMAVTAVVLVGFLIAHLLGNLLVYSGAGAINEYAVKLRDYPPLLWGARIVLLCSALIHVYVAVQLTLINRKAKPLAYQKKKSVKATFASKTMFLSGCLVLFFVLFHLAHLTFRWTHKEAFAYLDGFDVYSMLQISFASSYLTLFYVVSVIFVMFHLQHGVGSLFQTLGINHPLYNRLIRWFSSILSLVLALGFVSIPLCIYFKIVQ